MTIHPEMTVGELVAQHYRTAEVFKQYGIDFCCGGRKTIGKACSEKSIDWNALTAELDRALQVADPAVPDTQDWAPDFLADYIVQVHHRYLKNNLPPVLEYLNKISQVHGERHPELRLVARQTELLATDLLEHMVKEEQILFPYVKALCLARQHRQAAPEMPFGSIENPIRMMEHEHDYAGSLLENIYELTDGYQPPTDACTTYRLAFAKLQELDDDLRRHVHLENNVLFPKTLLLEQVLRHQN